MRVRVACNNSSVCCRQRYVIGKFLPSCMTLLRFPGPRSKPISSTTDSLRICGQFSSMEGSVMKSWKASRGYGEEGSRWKTSGFYSNGFNEMRPILLQNIELSRKHCSKILNRDATRSVSPSAKHRLKMERSAHPVKTSVGWWWFIFGGWTKKQTAVVQIHFIYLFISVYIFASVKVFHLFPVILIPIKKIKSWGDHEGMCLSENKLRRFSHKDH